MKKLFVLVFIMLLYGCVLPPPGPVPYEYPVIITTPPPVYGVYPPPPGPYIRRPPPPRGPIPYGP